MRFAEKLGLDRPATVNDEYDSERPEEGGPPATADTLRAPVPCLPVTAADLAAQQFVETYHGIATFRLANGRYHGD